MYADHYKSSPSGGKNAAFDRKFEHVFQRYSNVTPPNVKVAVGKESGPGW